MDVIPDELLPLSILPHAADYCGVCQYIPQYHKTSWLCKLSLMCLYRNRTTKLCLLNYASQQLFCSCGDSGYLLELAPNFPDYSPSYYKIYASMSLALQEPYCMQIYITSTI